MAYTIYRQANTTLEADTADLVKVETLRSLPVARAYHRMLNAQRDEDDPNTLYILEDTETGEILA